MILGNEIEGEIEMRKSIAVAYYATENIEGSLSRLCNARDTINAKTNAFDYAWRTLSEEEFIATLKNTNKDCLVCAENVSGKRFEIDTLEEYLSKFEA
jgi:hypothetical protein